MIPTARELLHRYVGVRAEGMVLVAAIWCLIGLQVVLEPPPNPPPPAVLYYMLPSPVRIALWVGSGMIALALSMSVRWSSWGLAALTVAPLERAFSWLWSWVMYLIPEAPAGDPRGWFNGLIWGCVALVPIFLSHIPAQVKPQHRGPR